MTFEIRYLREMNGVDWEEMKATLAADSIDNGRSPAQLEKSFRNSFAKVVATHKRQIIGTARALSDEVCNAYIVDVWTLSKF